RTATIQEPDACGALLFRVQYGLQPVSARTPCAVSTQLSHGDAPALAGMGRRVGDDCVRCRRVRSRPATPVLITSLFDTLAPDRENNLTTPWSANIACARFARSRRAGRSSSGIRRAHVQSSMRRGLIVQALWIAVA